MDVQVLSKARTQQDKHTLEMTEMEVSGRYDDAMDAFGMHGVRGIVGGILTGFFANDYVSDERGVFYGRGGCAARHPDLRHRRGRGLVVPYFLYHFDRFVEDHGRARVRYLQTFFSLRCMCVHLHTGPPTRCIWRGIFA